MRNRPGYFSLAGTWFGSPQDEAREESLLSEMAQTRLVGSAGSKNMIASHYFDTQNIARFVNKLRQRQVSRNMFRWTSQ